MAGGIYDVTLIRADVCSVEVTCEADMADDLRIAVKQGRLVLEIDQSGWSSADAGINRVCGSITCCEAPDDDVLAACQAMGRKLAE